MKVSDARFVTSATDARGIPHDGVPHVAFVGRSNVGKSSLLNALLKRDLARTSAAAGKTRLSDPFRAGGEGGPDGPRDQNRQAFTRRPREEPEGTGTATRNGPAAHVGNERRRTGRSVDTDSKTESVV